MKINKSLFVIILVILLDFIGVGILLPVIPILLTDENSTMYLLSNKYSIQYGYIFLGILTGLYSFMQFFAAPILGQLSDRIGRKKVLLISIFGTSISYILFAFGIILKNIPLLFFSRALDGITGGNISVAQAVIADNSEPENRAKNFALIGAAFGIGYVLGPILGSRLSDPNIISWFNASTPFWFAGILALINLTLVYFLLEDIYKPEKILEKINWFKPWVNFKKAFSRIDLKNIFIVEFGYYSGFSFFVTFLGVFLIYHFSMNQTQIGNFFSILGLCIVFAQTITTRKLAKYADNKTLLKFSLPLTALTISSLFISKNTILLYSIVPFIAIFNGLSLSNLNGLISKSANKNEQGEILGINSSIQAVAQSIPPMISGVIASIFTPSTPIIIGIILIGFSATFFIKNYFLNKN